MGIPIGNRVDVFHGTPEFPSSGCPSLSAAALLRAADAKNEQHAGDVGAAVNAVVRARLALAAAVRGLRAVCCLEQTFRGALVAAGMEVVQDDGDDGQAGELLAMPMPVGSEEIANAVATAGKGIDLYG